MVLKQQLLLLLLLFNEFSKKGPQANISTTAHFCSALVANF